MKNVFKPTWQINSIYDLSADNLKQHQIYGIICDLDNTLIAWNEEFHSDHMAQWLSELKRKGIGVYLVSNNNLERVAKVADPLELSYTHSALKPLNRSFKQALAYLDLEADEVAVVGDQLITDVLGANRMGLRSILVKPIVPHDNIYTWLNRSLERGIMKIQGINRHEDWGNQLD